MSQADLEPLSTLARVLTERTSTLDIISLHIPILELIEDSLVFVEDWDSDSVGESFVTDHLGRRVAKCRVLI